ncbi:MAG: hypothetical protein K6T80_01455 [Firmicutes bacterium]|nr:hypothetical protein [Bacillota bacterium]
MFFRKITSKSNGKEYTYLKLIENYREGDKVKQRVVANLGSLENLTPEKVENLISGLSRICGVPRPGRFEAKKMLRYGEVLAIHRVWEMLDVAGAVRDSFAGEKTDLSLPLLLELMAINQLVKPQDKEAVSDWYKCLYLPGLEGKELAPHHFYRALDSIAPVKDAIEQRVTRNAAALTGVDTGIVFCRLTRGTFEPAPRGDVNSTSYGRYILGEAAGPRSVEFGLLVSRDGMPFGHRMLSESAEEWEFGEIVESLRELYGTRHCLFVGERNAVTGRNLELLIAHGYHYLAGRNVWLARDRELAVREMAAGLEGFREMEGDLWCKEVKEGGTRYILCYSPREGRELRASLRERLAAVEKELAALQAPAGGRGRSGAVKRAAVLKDKFARKFFQWEFDDASGEFRYRARDGVLEQEQKTAGVFILETNSVELDAGELLRSYTGSARLADSLKEVKSFEFRPNQHYTELNLSANLFVCVLAAMVETALERILRRAGLEIGSRRALALLEEVKLAVSEAGGEEVRSVTSVRAEQGRILRAVGVADIEKFTG